MARLAFGHWKIVSDGRRAWVYDKEGNEVPGVRAISWRIDANSLGTAVVELIGVGIEAEIADAARGEAAPPSEINPQYVCRDPKCRPEYLCAACVDAERRGLFPFRVPR